MIRPCLTLLAAAIVASAAIAAGQTSPATAPVTIPEDPLANSRRINAEIEQLKQTPVAKQMAEIEVELRKLVEKNNKERQPIVDKARAVERSAAWEEMSRKLSELEKQREDKWAIERKAIIEKARAIYKARHDELQRFAPPQTPEAAKLNLDLRNYPQIDGSTSTLPLAVIVACRFLGEKYEWSYPEPTGWPHRSWGRGPSLPDDLAFSRFEGGMKYDRSDSDFNFVDLRPHAQPPADASPTRRRVALNINSLLAVGANTHVAYENLITGKCDLNLTARAPSDDEQKLAAEKKVKIALVPIARDALVFIANHRNPIKSLTQQQIRDIYAGKIATWKDLGVTSPKTEDDRNDFGKISAIRRDRNSGSRELFDRLVAKDQQFPEPEGRDRDELYSGSMSGPYNRVSLEINALAYSVYYYEHFMAASPYTRTVAIDGIEPTFDTIASGKYPLSSPVYIAYREGTPADSPAMKLAAWMVTPEGQAVIRESGYVPTK